MDTAGGRGFIQNRRQREHQPVAGAARGTEEGSRSTGDQSALLSGSNVVTVECGAAESSIARGTRGGGAEAAAGTQGDALSPHIAQYSSHTTQHNTALTPRSTRLLVCLPGCSLLRRYGHPGGVSY